MSRTSLQGPCAAAGKTDVEVLLTEIGGVAVDLSMAQGVAQKLKEPQPKYAELVESFLTEAKGKVEQTTDEVVKVFEQYADTHDYYGEDTSTVGTLPAMVQTMMSQGTLVQEVEGYNTRTVNFFSTIVQFIGLYKAAVEDNKKKERVLAARKAREDKLASKKPANESSSGSIASEAVVQPRTKSPEKRSPKSSNSPRSSPKSPSKRSGSPAKTSSAPMEVVPEKPRRSNSPAKSIAPATKQDEEEQLPASVKAKMKGKDPLQQQIAMKAAMKLKQMKAAKANKQ